MAKVKFYMNSGANIKSKKTSRELDTVEDLGMEDGEWEQMSDDDKYEIASKWCWQNGLEIGYEDL